MRIYIYIYTEKKEEEEKVGSEIWIADCIQIGPEAPAPLIHGLTRPLRPGDLGKSMRKDERNTVDLNETRTYICI